MAYIRSEILKPEVFLVEKIQKIEYKEIFTDNYFLETMNTYYQCAD